MTLSRAPIPTNIRIPRHMLEWSPYLWSCACQPSWGSSAGCPSAGCRAARRTTSSGCRAASCSSRQSSAWWASVFHALVMAVGHPPPRLCTSDVIMTDKLDDFVVPPMIKYDIDRHSTILLMESCLSSLSSLWMILRRLFY